MKESGKQFYRFALTGAAGYIAPRHMKAIKATGNQIVAILDPFDSMGVIDSYFPEADFFTEPERFDRHLDKLRRQKVTKIDYVSICSPNYLHDAHIRFALRNQAHAICEKPLVLNPWNVDALREIENETGKNINVILQLRLHPEIIRLKEKISKEKDDKIYDIDLAYITTRGNWYFRSWKGDQEKSGGVATNIGIHFFDMLIYIFGDVEKNTIHYMDERTVSGFLHLKHARVRWILSLDHKMLPENVLRTSQRTFRLISVNGEELEFSGGFDDLHTESYKRILKYEGFTSLDARPSIQLVYEIRNSKPAGVRGDYHPYLNKLSIK
jgi:UDP-N-acetyl-2-amino-2-deoxyglucuronate dehydrogenase